jgi:hypothetical protein
LTAEKLADFRIRATAEWKNFQFLAVGRCIENVSFAERRMLAFGLINVI